MEYQESVIELIQKRNSCRTYAHQAIEADKMIQLNACIADINAIAAEEALKARYILVNRHHDSGQTAEKLGTYGVITGAEVFFVGIIAKSESEIAKFGYFFEKLILFARDLGLGTCWLGGAFNRADFQRMNKLAEDEFIPIVSPVGYARERRAIMDQLVRMAAGSAKRKAWHELFFLESVKQPLDQATAGLYATPLEMVRLGPSASNKQPWRVLKDSDGFSFYLARTSGYASMGFDMQLNDLGIAMCHFELTALELKLPGRWQVLNTGKSVAEMQYVATWVI